MDGMDAECSANVTIIMPTLDPDEKTLQVIEGLNTLGLNDIIIVDDRPDGTTGDGDAYLLRAAQMGCEVIHNTGKPGKGAALRCGFARFLETRGEKLGAVTMDCDGQHRPQDAARCAQMLAAHPDSIILGRRNLSDRSLPRHSRLSGKITSLMIGLFCGLKIRDPQSGLRAIPASALPQLLDIGGERYEYEINILLESKTRSLPVVEVDIDADYSAEDRTTHYRYVRDSVRVNSVFLIFALSSFSSFAVDALAFWLFAHFFNGAGGKMALWSVPLATACARVISTTVAYLINRKRVFHSNGNHRRTIGRYIICAGGIMIISALGTWALTGLFSVGQAWAQTLLKCCVDTLLFFVNFRIQHEWVFAEKKEK